MVAIVKAGGVSFHPGYRSSLYYSMFGGTSTTGTPAIDTHYTYPFPIQQRVVLTGLALRSVGGGTSSHVKMAIYANSAGRPVGAPLAVNNTGGSTTGANADIALSISVALDPGVYWFSQKHDGTPGTFTAIATATWGINALVGKASSLSTPVLGLSLSDTYSNNFATLDGTEAWANVVTAIVPIINIGT